MDERELKRLLKNIAAGLYDLEDDGHESAGGEPQSGLRSRRIGLRWIASRGKKACPQCAALHGKVFYYKPGPGQASVDDMPKGELHPNCRCTRQPVSDFVSPSPPKFTIKPFSPTIHAYMRNQVEHGLWGELVRSKEVKSLGCAPVHGKY